MTIPSKLSSKSEGMKRANISTEAIFRRGLALAELREDVKIGAFMSHPIVSVPLSLSNEDGILRKTIQSNAALYLESLSNIPDVDEMATDNGTYIRDGMTLLHSLTAETCTPSNDMVFKYVRRVASDIKIADKVKDAFVRYYVQHSIKGTEQKRRSGTLKSATQRTA